MHHPTSGFSTDGQKQVDCIASKKTLCGYDAGRSETEIPLPSHSITKSWSLVYQQSFATISYQNFRIINSFENGQHDSDHQWLQLFMEIVVCLLEDALEGLHVLSDMVHIPYKTSSLVLSTMIVLREASKSCKKLVPILFM